MSEPKMVRAFHHKCRCGDQHTVHRINPDWLRWYRKRCGYSLREMARKLGVSAAFLCDIEYGRRWCPHEIENGYKRQTP